MKELLFRSATLTAAAAFLAAMSTTVAAEDKIASIRDAGTLKVCQIDYPPLNKLDPTTGQWTGLLVEMSEAFAAELELEIEHVDSTWGTVLQNVQTGRCDMSAAATFVTAKRAMEVLFTDTVTEDSQAAFVQSDSEFKSYEDLDQPGNVVVVISGSLNEQNAQTVFSQAEIKPIVTDRQQTALLEVATGRADAAFVSAMSTLNFISTNENLEMRQVDDSKLFPSPIAWIVPAGEYHFQQVINAWLASARAKGSIPAMEARWLSTN